MTTHLQHEESVSHKLHEEEEVDPDAGKDSKTLFPRWFSQTLFVPLWDDERFISLTAAARARLRVMTGKS